MRMGSRHWASRFDALPWDEEIGERRWCNEMHDQTSPPQEMNARVPSCRAVLQFSQTISRAAGSHPKDGGGGRKAGDAPKEGLLPGWGQVGHAEHRGHENEPRHARQPRWRRRHHDSLVPRSAAGTVSLEEGSLEELSAAAAEVWAAGDPTGQRRATLRAIAPPMLVP